MSFKTLCYFTFFAYCSLTSLASTASASKQLLLNGTAVYTNLQQDYYYAALFSESLSKDPQMLLWQDNQRMEITILVDEWSKRRFTGQLRQAITINNSIDNQEHNADDIALFNHLIKDYLIRGDRVVIEKDSDRGTSIRVNGVTLMATDSHDFFTLFLNTWIGARPPSSTFKASILGQQSTIDSSMMASYESLSASANRIEEIKAWHNNDNTKRKAITDKTDKETPIVKATTSKAEPFIIETQPEYVDTTEQIDPEDTNLSIAAEYTSFDFDDKPIASVSHAKKAKQSSIIADESNKSIDQSNKGSEKSSTSLAANAINNTASNHVANGADNAIIEQEKAIKKDLLKFYRSTLLTSTYKKIVYPPKAIDKNQQGKVVLRVTVNREGKVKSINLKEKSKFKLLNQAANKAVAKAHYPNVPSELEGDEFEFLLPIKFSLN